MNFRTGTEISAAARSVHCRKYFLPPTHTKGFLQYHTARPGPARHGSDQARSGLTSPATERKLTACLRTRTCFAHHPVRLGPARPGPARHGLDQARSGLTSPATERKPTACLRTRTCFAHHPVRLGPARHGSAQARPGPISQRKGDLTARSHSHTVFHTPASKDLQDQYGFPSGWPRPAQAPRTHGLNTPRPGTGGLC